MKNQIERNKKKLENKVDRINDNLDALIRKPQKGFRLKTKNKPQASPRPQNEGAEVEEAKKNVSSQIDALAFNEKLNFLPGNLNKDFFSLTSDEIDAITTNISSLKQQDIQSIQNLQRKLFITYQYIQEGLQSIFEEEASLDTRFDAVSEKVSQLTSILHSIDKKRSGIEKEQIQNFNQRKTLIHQHAQLNSRENNIEEQESIIQKRKVELNRAFQNIEDQKNAIKIQEERLAEVRDNLLREKFEMKNLKSELMRQDQEIDDKYFDVKKKYSEIKSQEDKLKIEIKAFKNIRTKAKDIKEQHKKIHEQYLLKKRAVSKISVKMENQKNSFLNGKVQYQKMIDQIDHLSSEVTRLENRKNTLISDNLELHKSKSELSEKIQILKNLTQVEMQNLSSGKQSLARQKRQKSQLDA